MTGALEVGAKFSAAGIPALVSAKPLSTCPAGVVVFDTETRHVTPEKAASEVRRFLLESGPATLIYKKTDSTLRGNISAELQALAQLYPGWGIAYAPAYPAMGRTVKLGVLYVDGIAVAETDFANDALNPIRSSSIASILHPELKCVVFDGETDAHLAEAARAILCDESLRIAAGPAALAETIAREIDLPRSAVPALPPIRKCLVLNGSRHEISATQVHYAMRHVEGTGWRMLQKSCPPGADALSIAAANGKHLMERIAAEDPDAVFVIGGDTAFALVKALGLPPLLPIAEAVPGVPVTRIEARHVARTVSRNRDLFLITKAGGFGGPDVISRVRAILSHAG